MCINIYTVYIPTHKSKIPFLGETNFVYAITKEYHLDRPMDIFNGLHGGGEPLFLAVCFQNIVFQQ